MISIKKQLARAKTLVFILIAVVAVLLIILVVNNRRTSLPPDTAIAQVSLRDIERVVSTEGKIAGIDERQLYAPTGSKVTEVKVSLGETVTQGEAIFTLDYNGRVQDITTPILGVVTYLNYASGELVLSPTTPVATITDSSSYTIEGFVNETEVENIAIDQEVRLFLSSLADEKEYLGKVRTIAPAPSLTSSAVNYPLTISPEDLPSSVRLGMSADLEIITAEKTDVLAIPENFVIEKDEKYYALLISWTNEKTSYETTEVEIEIGLETDTYVEIISGLQEGDEVLDPSINVQRRTFGFF